MDPNQHAHELVDHQVMNDQLPNDQLQYRHPYQDENDVVENAF